MSPLANDEHQELVQGFAFVFQVAVVWPGLGMARPGVNVSDRVEDWKSNYRIPDVAVFLNDTTARNCDTHWCGGPDFVVEILSEGDRAREKLDFYARNNVRELLIVDRHPWALELYRLRDGQLIPFGVAHPESPTTLASAVLPLSFRLVPGVKRPRIEVTHADGVQRWEI